jgi:peptidylprolyl isomerase
MRRFGVTRTPLLCLLAALTLAAAGCSSSGADADGGASVTTATDEKPEITIPDEAPPTELVVDVAVEGDGEAVEEGDLLVADYVGVLWDSGEQFDSSWEGEEPRSFPIGVDGVIQGWDDGLVGQSVGSRVLLTVPPALGYGDEETETIPADSTLVFAVDIRDAFSAADAVGGTEVSDLPADLPTVSGEPGEQPTIEVDGVEPPDESRATVLIEGAGDPLVSGASVVVEAFGVAFDTGETVLSTWEGTPEAVPPDSLPGLADALDGQNAGARLLLELPPAADGGGQAVALVLDVLGSVQRSPSGP